MSKTPDKVKKYEDRIMDVFAFDENDLEANQAGHLSQQQMVRLKKARNRAISTFALLAMLFGFLAIIIVAAGFQASGILPPLAAGLLAVLAIYAIFGRNAQALLKDMRTNQVALAEGRVDLSLNALQNTAEYFLRVENMRFTIKQNAFLTFKNGDPYRIYYAPRSKRILSVEWLREDDNLVDKGEYAELQVASEPDAAAIEAHNDQSSMSTTNAT